MVKRFKFERVKAAAQPLVESLDTTLPCLDPHTVVVPLPTAPGHIRQRGYDHALLLARGVAKRRGLVLAPPLLRHHSQHQVGANRQQRIRQAKTAYKLKLHTNVKGKKVLLIDDICTTGASLAAAAKLVRKAGAQEVNAAVVAWQKME